MAIDFEKHIIDPATGFALDKETGRPVGLVPAPHAPVAEGTEWPKWVQVHDSHVVRKVHDDAPASVSVAGFEQFHLNRVDGTVTVLVHDEDEEASATSEVKVPESEPPMDPAPESDPVLPPVDAPIVPPEDPSDIA